MTEIAITYRLHPLNSVGALGIEDAVMGELGSSVEGTHARTSKVRGEFPRESRSIWDYLLYSTGYCLGELDPRAHWYLRGGSSSFGIYEIALD